MIDIAALGIVGALGFIAYQLYVHTTAETSRTWIYPYDEKQYAPDAIDGAVSITRQAPQPYYQPSLMKYRYDVSSDAQYKSKQIAMDGVRPSGFYVGNDYADSTVYVNEY